MIHTVSVPYAPPLAWPNLLGWLRVRALPGVEIASDAAYEAAVSLPGGPAVLRMTNDEVRAVIHVAVTGRPGADLDEADAAAVRRVVTRMLDLDADPGVIDAALAEVPVVGALVQDAPGMRIPGEPTPLLALLRALAGQQVSVAGGLAQMYRLVETHQRAPAVRSAADGGETDEPSRQLTPFPDAPAILHGGFDWYRGPSARRETNRAAVELAASGGLDVSRGTDAIADDLLAIKGVGPWTVAYTLMRGYGHPDVDLSGDRALVNAARALGDVSLGEILGAARPFRSYAALHLWRSAGS